MLLYFLGPVIQCLCAAQRLGQRRAWVLGSNPLGNNSMVTVSICSVTGHRRLSLPGVAKGSDAHAQEARAVGATQLIKTLRSVSEPGVGNPDAV